MQNTKIIGVAIGIWLATAAGAQAAACRDYSRSVYLGGIPYAAAGTACLGEDGVWRVADEHLQGPEATIAPETVAYVAPAPAAYYEPYAYPAPYFYDPVFFSFGFGGYYGGHGGGYYHHH